MALYDAPTHRVSTYTVTSGPRDAGGGTPLGFALAQSAVPCIVNTSSSSEQERFAMMQIAVTHRISFLTSALTTALTRGMKIVAENGDSFHVHGIEHVRGYGGVPSFVYASCEQLL